MVLNTLKQAKHGLRAKRGADTLNQGKLSDETLDLKSAKARTKEVKKLLDDFKKQEFGGNIPLEVLDLLAKSVGILEKSLRDKSTVRSLNVKEFDENANKILESHELRDFRNQANQMLGDVLKLGDMEEYRSIQDYIATNYEDEADWMKRANNFDLGKATVSLAGMSKSEQAKLLSAKFDDPMNFMKGLGIAIAVEAPNMGKDMMMFLGDIVNLATVNIDHFAEYIGLRTETKWIYDKLMGNEMDSEHEEYMKMRALGEIHPLLGLCNLAGEQGVEMLKQLGLAMANPSSWTAQGLVQSVVGILGIFISGGASVSRLGVVAKLRKAKKLRKSGNRAGARAELRKGKVHRERAKKLEKADKVVSYFDTLPISALSALVGKMVMIKRGGGMEQVEVMKVEENGTLDVRGKEGESSIYLQDIDESSLGKEIKAQIEDQDINKADDSVHMPDEFIRQATYENMEQLPPDLRSALNGGEVDIIVFATLNDLKWMKEFKTEDLIDISRILCSGSDENEILSKLAEGPLFNEHMTEKFLDNQKHKVADVENYNDPEVRSYLNDPIIKELLDRKVPREFIEKNFTAEHLASLSLEEYITLLQQVPARFVTHATRHGFRDRTSHHNYDADPSFHSGFKNLLQDKAVRSILDNDFQGQYTRENVEKSKITENLNDNGGYNRIDQFLNDKKHMNIISEFADKNAVHGTLDFVADHYYGTEGGNSIFVVHPAAFIASQYRVTTQGQSVPDGFYTNKDKRHDDKNDLWMMRKTDNRGVLPIDSGIVFIPANTRVDPKTGSKYATGTDSMQLESKPLAQETISSKEYWERHFERTGNRPSKVVFYEEGDPNDALEAFRARNGLYNGLHQNTSLTDLFPENMVNQKEMRDLLNKEASDYQDHARAIFDERAQTKTEWNNQQSDLKLSEAKKKRLDLDWNTIEKNMRKMPDKTRRDKTNKLLKGEYPDGISAVQFDALIKAHEVPFGNNVQKGLILMREGGFSRVEAEKIMDNGLAGEIPKKQKDDPFVRPKETGDFAFSHDEMAKRIAEKKEKISDEELENASKFFSNVIIFDPKNQIIKKNGDQIIIDETVLNRVTSEIQRLFQKHDLPLAGIDYENGIDNFDFNVNNVDEVKKFVLQSLIPNEILQRLTERMPESYDVDSNTFNLLNLKNILKIRAKMGDIKAIGFHTSNRDGMKTITSKDDHGDTHLALFPNKLCVRGKKLYLVESYNKNLGITNQSIGWYTSKAHLEVLAELSFADWKDVFGVSGLEGYTFS